MRRSGSSATTLSRRRRPPGTAWTAAPPRRSPISPARRRYYSYGPVSVCQYSVFCACDAIWRGRIGSFTSYLHPPIDAVVRSAMVRCLSVYVCMCLSQIGVLSKRLDESAGRAHGSFLRPILHCIIRKFGYLQK